MMTKSHDAWIAEQRDRSGIEQAIQRYFAGLDRGDAALNQSAFTPDGRMFVDGIQRRGPGAAPPDQLAPPPGVPPAHQILGFTHSMHQADIRLDGDRAFGEVYATATVLIDVGAGPRVLMRGIRYIDRYARVGDAWLIEERHHNVDWMFEAPAPIAVGLPQRQGLPAYLRAHGVAETVA